MTRFRSAACSARVHLRKPSPVLKPRRPSVDEPRDVGHRPGTAVEVGQDRLLDVAEKIGADEVGILQRAEHGEPAAEARLDHGVDASRRRRRPLWTSATASRHSACWRRLPMKPGTSFITRTGVLPTDLEERDHAVDRRW